jgi:hypothetical protein
VTHFYKYVTAGTGRAILENGTLRWSAPAVLNDPFDMQFAFQIPDDLDNVKALAAEKHRKHIAGEWLDKPLNNLGRFIRSVRVKPSMATSARFQEELTKSFDASLEKLASGMPWFNAEVMGGQFANARICCFSDTPTNILMWSYYAENHAGLVLRFTDDTPDGILRAAKQVRYVEQMPPLYDEDELSDTLAGYGGLPPERITDRVVWTKSSHWQHEHEWRVYGGDGRTVATFEDRPFGALELDGIIFGLRMELSACADFCGIIKDKYPHAELLHTMSMTNKYELRIERL